MNATDIVAARSRKHAEELFYALRELLEDTQHVGHNCGESGCPVAHARELVEKIEGGSAQQKGPQS